MVVVDVPISYTPFTLPLLLASLATLCMALYGWPRRHTVGVKTFIYLALAESLWSAAYALELGANSLDAAILLVKIEYLSIASIPALWLVFAIQYTEREEWLTRRNLLLLSIVPLLTLTLVWTNESHSLIWNFTGLDTSGFYSALEFTYGPFFWVHFAHGYLAMLGGTVLIFWMLLTTPHLYRGQTIPLIIGATAPWLGNAIYITGLSPFYRLDLTPFAFTLASLAIGWAIFRHKLLNLLPVAYSAVIKNMRDGLIVLDESERIVEVNPVAERIIGIPGSAAMGRPAKLVLSGISGMIPLLENEISRTTVAIPDEQEERAYDIIAGDIPRPRGQAKGRTIVFHDVTGRVKAEEILRLGKDELEALVGERTAALRKELAERVRVEAALRDSESKFRTLAESIATGAFICSDSRVLYVNQGLEKITGFPRDELVAMDLKSFIHPGFASLLEEHRHACQDDQDAPRRFEAAFHTRDGEERWIDATIADLDFGGVAAVLGTVTDATDRKRVEEQKDSIISMVSHELRTPIHHVRSYASSLLQTDVKWDEEIKLEFIRTIDQESKRLGDLVSNILEMSRLGSSNQSALNLSLICPRDLVSFSLEDVPFRLQQHHLSVDMPETLPSVLADPERMKLVFTNLLDNAAKYSPGGSSIRLTARTEEGEVMFSVKDEGQGIPNEERERIFERFTRLYRSGAPQVPGTGLGLAICKMIVTGHKGRIWVDSIPGGGSTFSFTLPITPESNG